MMANRPIPNALISIGMSTSSPAAFLLALTLAIFMVGKW